MLLGLFEDLEDMREVPATDPDLLWDCVHPCALLSLLAGSKGNLGADVYRLRRIIDDTLYNYGWSKNNKYGEIDVERAKKELGRVAQIDKVQKQLDSSLEDYLSKTEKANVND
jgi:hypothetical protein